MTCGSSVDNLEEAALAAILMYCGTSPPPCFKSPAIHGRLEGRTLGRSWTTLGHPWETLCPSVDDLSPISTSTTITACATKRTSAVLNSHRSDALKCEFSGIPTMFQRSANSIVLSTTCTCGTRTTCTTWDIDHLVDVVQLWKRYRLLKRLEDLLCATTGMSTTLSMESNNGPRLSPR